MPRIVIGQAGGAKPRKVSAFALIYPAEITENE
jgi:hypothetical protein